ncbi:MAG: hypothetical protein ACKV2Q_35520 [Planctomycetaceae bacterium]
MIRTPFDRRIISRGIFAILVAWPLLSGLCLARVRADEPELTSLIGEDVGLCVELRNLRSHLRDVPSAEWFRRVKELPFVKRWQQGPEFTKWQMGQATLTVVVGQPLDLFASELFGDSVVLAISPSQAGGPGGVLLSRAAKDDTWDRVLTLWDQLEAHDVQSKSAFGRSFQRRQKKTNGQTTGPDIYTVKLGRILAISEREELIRDVLARFASIPDADRVRSLDQSPTYRQAMASLPEPCAVRVFANPRRWENELRKDSATAERLLPLWEKLEWVSAGLELRDGIIGHAVVHHETIGLPLVWQKLVEASATPSDLASRLPGEAVVAGEVRIAPELLSWLRTLNDSEKARNDWQTFGKVTRGLLGRDLFEDVLPHTQPSLGGAVVPKLPVDERSAPVDGLLAWQLDWSRGSSPVDGQPELRESLDGALLTLLNFAAVAHNSRNPDLPATLRVRHREALTLKWLDRLPPYRPAFGLSTEHLLLATDPQLISAFHDRTADGRSLKTEPLFAAVHSRHIAEHSHWLFLNSQAASTFLAEQHEPLSRQVAHWRKVAAPSVAVQLDRVREFLTPFDAAFVAAKVAPGEVRFTAGAITPKP